MGKLLKNSARINLKIGSAALRLWRELASRALLAYLIRLTTVGFNFLSIFIIVRLLSIDDYGRYALLLTAASLATLILSLGSSQLAAKELARERGRGQPSGVARVLAYVFVVNGASTVMILVTAWPIITLGREVAGGAMPLVLSGLWAVTNLWLALGVGILSGYERVTTAQLVGLLQPAFTVLLAGAVLVSGARPSSLEVVLTIGVTSSAVAGVLAWIKAFENVKELAPRIRYAMPRMSDLRAFGKNGLSLATYQLLVNMMTNVDVVMLGLLSTPADVAHYHVAARIANIALMIVGAVHVVIAPKLARAWGAHDFAEFQRLLRSGSLAAFLGVAGLALALLSGGGFVLGLFGPDFVNAKTVLVILLSGFVAFTAFGLSDSALSMSSWPGYVTLAFGVANAVNALANIVMIPKFGALGAAISSASALVMLALILWGFCLKGLKIRADIFSVALAVRN